MYSPANPRMNCETDASSRRLPTVMLRSTSCVSSERKSSPLLRSSAGAVPFMMRVMSACTAACARVTAAKGYCVKYARFWRSALSAPKHSPPSGCAASHSVTSRRTPCCTAATAQQMGLTTSRYSP